DAFAGGSYEKTYKFIHSAAYSDLSLDYIDPSNLVKEITVYPPASAAASGTAVDNYYEKEFKIQFSSNIQDLVPDNGDSLSVQLIASYKPDGSTETKLAYLEIRVEDGTCVCPAKISATQWLNFACHNLGALDILSSSQLITRAHHGHWYRFGARAASMVNTPEHDTNNTWDDSYYLNNGERWNTQPCPAGWRLPTISELAAAVNKTESGGSLGTDNNTLARSGTWINSTTNFSVLLKVGDYLYLPVAGLRQSTNGDLDHRGNNGFYWSSSHGTTSCKSMDFDSENQFVNSRGRASGLSVRCVAAE
ncbi:MAG: fibrobacter succinogenes major paralogous domain-containing protein, partial [Dysgonamonadaceae bacterium]|nr:fibrobacter succinogenes major paralogous domain-containing protein [Dysgonamonadaceae bacterium]